MSRDFFARTNDVRPAIKYTEYFKKLNNQLSPAVDYRKEGRVFVSVIGGVAQTGELPSQAVVEELVPLGPEHMVIGSFSPL